VALDVGAEGVEAAKRLGDEAMDRAKSMKGRFSRRLAARRRRRELDEERGEQG
jgi:hypothetical protein